MYHAVFLVAFSLRNYLHDDLERNRQSEMDGGGNFDPDGDGNHRLLFGGKFCPVAGNWIAN